MKRKKNENKGRHKQTGGVEKRWERTFGENLGIDEKTERGLWKI